LRHRHQGVHMPLQEARRKPFVLAWPAWIADQDNIETLAAGTPRISA
jgi:hypothetical protein